MTTTVKITELSNIGANLSYTTLIPVVSTVGMPITQKANLQVVGNLILSGAGGSNFVPAYLANLSYSVTNAAQPNITSVGTLTSLNVSGNITVAGRASVNSLNVTGNVTSNLLPNANVTYNLGSSTQRWNDIWLANSTIYLGDATISANGNSIVVDSITITEGNVGNIGNIASINLNGNADTVLRGDGTWGAGGNGGGSSLPLANGTSNFNIATANGNATITANGAYTWQFDNTGNLILPANSFAFKYANGDPIVFNQLGNFEITGNVMMLNDANIDMLIQHSADDITSIRLIPDGSPEPGVHIETGNMSVMHHWIFDDAGDFIAPGNVTMAGTRINIGPNANVVPLTDPSIVAIGNSTLVQMAIINTNSNGSSDYIMYGSGGDETQGWAGVGFNGPDFDVPIFSATRPGDGGFFVQGYDSGIGGNLVLATGDKGLGQDIIFVLGGFVAESEFGRISLSNNAFELNKEGAAFSTPPSTPLTIQTPTVGVSGNTAEWDYTTPTLENAKGQWQGTGTYADNVTLYTTVSDIDPLVVEFWEDESHTIPYTLPTALFGAVGDFVYGTKAIDVTIRGGPAVSNVRGIGGNIILSANDGVETIWTFSTDGNLNAPGNVILSGQEVLVGPGANTLGLADSTLVISSTSTAYLQAVINNVSDIGSADWVAQGHYGSDDGGYVDLGFNSVSFSDPEFDMTGPGDGYLFVSGYQVGQAPSTGGGNLILTTSSEGTTKDIIFGTGGFTSANIFGRISDANNAFELSRSGSYIQLPDGSVFDAGGIYGNDTAILSNGSGAVQSYAQSTGFGIQTGDGNATIHTWTFDNTGVITLPSGNVTIGSLFGADAILASNTPFGVVSQGNASTVIQWIDDISNASALSAIYINSPSGGTGDVVVSTGAVGPGANIWNFTANGVLILANGNSTIQSTANSSLDPTNPNVSTMTLTPDANYSSQVLVLDPTAPGHIHLRAYAFSNIDDPAANIFLGGEDTSFEITSGPNNEARIHSGGDTWIFGNDGNLTIPGSSGGFIKTVANSSIGIAAIDNGTDNPAQLLSINANGTATTALSAYANLATIQANINGAIKTWAFDNTGNMILPGNTLAINFANGSGAFGNIISWTTAPGSNTAAGNAGEAAYDSGGNLFVCVATNTWAKFAGTTSW